MATLSMKNCTDAHHLAPVDSFCTQCKTNVCKHCIQRAHFDHIDAMQYRAKEVLDLVNILTKVKAQTSKSMHIQTAIIRLQNVEAIAKEQEDLIRKAYAQLDAFTKAHKQDLLWKIRLSKFVTKLREMFNDAKSKRAQLEVHRKEYADRIKKLLDAQIKGKYTPDLIILAGVEEIEKQKKEMESYKTLGAELQKYIDLVNKLAATQSMYTQEKVKLRDICQLDTSKLAGENLYLVKKNSSEIWSYCPDTKKSEKIALVPLYTAPLNFGIVEIDKFLYVIGGNRQDSMGVNIFLDTLTKIDLESKTHTALPSMKNKRRRAGAVSVKNKEIYVMGGDRENEFLDSCEKYDIEKKEWTVMPPMTEAKINVSAGVFTDRVIYCFGGFSKANCDLDTIEMLDTLNAKAWEKVKLSNPQYWSPVQNMGVIQISPSEMLLFGGMRVRKETNQSLIFKVSDGKFEKAADMAGSDTFLQERPKMMSIFVYAFGCHHGDLHVFNTKTRTWGIVPSAEWAPK